MGREIRKVPKGWEHPKTDRYGKEAYEPLYDEDYEAVAAEWLRECILWINGEHPDQNDATPSTQKYFWEYDCGPPSKEDYRPAWTDEERTCIQMYETVSEGTPVSPVFETPEELVEYLVEGGDEWDRSRGTGGRSREAAEAFVKGGWAPSGVAGPSGIKFGIDSLVD